MNVRVSVIILAAAIFMAVWDADQKAMEKDRGQIARQRASQQALLAQKATVTPAASAADSVVKADANATSATAANVATPVVAVSSGTDCIPLPARLAAGTWQVTNDQGQESRITIHSTPATGEIEQSFCIITTENGRRWCFVKTPESIQAAAATTDTSVR